MTIEHEEPGPEPLSQPEAEEAATRPLEEVDEETSGTEGDSTPDPMPSSPDEP